MIESVPLRKELEDNENSQEHIMKGFLILIDILAHNINRVLAGNEQFQFQLFKLVVALVENREDLEFYFIDVEGFLWIDLEAFAIAVVGYEWGDCLVEDFARLESLFYLDGPAVDGDVEVVVIHVPPVEYGDLQIVVIIVFALVKGCLHLDPALLLLQVLGTLDGTDPDPTIGVPGQERVQTTQINLIVLLGGPPIEQLPIIVILGVVIEQHPQLLQWDNNQSNTEQEGDVELIGELITPLMYFFQHIIY